MLWLCLHFPRLSLEIFTRASPDPAPLVVVDRPGSAAVIVAANADAIQAGLCEGMRLSAAQALVQGLQVRARDAAAEQAALKRIAAWACQFTSFVSLAPPRSVLIEIGGSLTLFGGSERLRTRIRADAQELGFAARLSAAPTPLGAEWLAHAAVDAWIETPAPLVRALGRLPLARLDLPARTQRALANLGLEHLGECLRLPRDGLARRFGQEFLDRLDQACGRLPDPRPAFVPPAHFAGRLAFPAAVGETEALLFGARRLLLELQGFLRARDSGVRRLVLELIHRRPPATRIGVGLIAPRREPRHLLLLLRERLQQTTLREPVQEIVLHARGLQPWSGRSEDLFQESQARERVSQAAPGHPGLRGISTSCTSLLERLQARLGREAVQGLDTAPEHRPERAWRYCAPGQDGDGFPAHARPFWLLPAPAVLEECDGAPVLHGALRLTAGPERIESGWWDEDAARDYFVAEDSQGARLWIFRERRPPRRWFLHGIFA